MSLTQVTGPYPIFTDLDGSPLDDGYLYIGDQNDDPETNPIQVYWDSALTIPATQPIRTNSGYAWRNGTPGLLYTAGAFSITIRNKRNEFVLYSPVGYGFDPAAVSASVVKNDFTGNGVEVDFTLSAAPSTILATNVFINGVYQEKDSYSLLGNVITFSVAPPLNSSIEVMTNETGVINSGNATAISYTLTEPGAVAQTVQTKLDQYVSVKDFGAVGDGVADDTAAVLAAIATGSNVDFVNCNCKVTSQITLNSNQTLYASGGGGILGDVPDYVIKAQGNNGSAISSVTAAIPALTWTITMASPVGLSAGDQILLYDVVADEYEVNRIQTIISNTVYTTWPITQAFTTPANIRLYKMTPIENAKIDGLKITNVNLTGGGGVRFIYTKNCEVTNCTFDNVKYISYSAEASVSPVFSGNRVIKSGASGSGLRVTKAGRITENEYVDTQSDESITLYKSNSHAIVGGNNVAQYLFGSGGTAGNSILIDQRNYYNTIIGNVCDGSATYHIYVFSNSSFNTIVGNTLNRANLGSIKIESLSDGNTLDNNICTNVVDATDPFEGGAATAAIRVKAGCSGNIIGPSNIFAALSGVAIVDGQASPRQGYLTKLSVNSNTNYQTSTVQGNSGLITSDFVPNTTGTAATLSLGAATGNTFGQLNIGVAGDSAVGHLALMRFGGSVAVGRTAPASGALFEVNGNIVANIPSAAPTLGINNDMSFQLVSNTQLRILVRGSDGTTRSNTLTLS
jgi:hypothetical protein